MGRGMSRASRLQRIEELLLGAPNGLTIRQIARKLGVHRTTVWRDLNEISRDVPVQQASDRYWIDRKDYLSSIRLTGGESLMIYLTLRRILRRGSHIPAMMRLALEKLSLTLRDPSRDQFIESLQAMQNQLPSDPEQAQIWETLVQSWVDCVVVRLKYQPFQCSVVEQDEVQPYSFEPAVLSEGVYLIGYSLTHEKIRLYSVERILAATLTTTKFDRPEKVVLDTVLRNIWSEKYGEEVTEVRLRFHDPLVARRVKKTVWLPSQKLIELPSGGVEWTVQVPDVFELVPWIRGWGPDCEVVAPVELQQILEEVQEELGGVTMATVDEPRTLSFSDEFYQSLHEVFDGDRIRVCLQCSSCSGICPFGHVMEYHPRKMIAALRAGVFDKVMDTDSVWMCVSCYACTEVCPASIPITSALMTRTKEEMLLSGNVPAELQDALENSQRYGNPLGESPRKRADWANGLKPEVPIMAKLDRPVDVLWFVGDYASYHPRVQKVAVAFAKILQALDVDFAILGPEEQSDGDSQRMAGERGLFEMLAEKNGKAFAKYEFKEIVTTDPHAFNALKNEYTELGISYPVRHYTEFLSERIEDLKPLLKNGNEAVVTYHDPCYLGRVNGVYEAPRDLLRAIPGLELVEMAHNHANSLCCGGGGGGMWLDGFQWEKAHERMSEWRVREAVAASGVDIEFCTALPEKGKKPRKKKTDPEEPKSVGILAVACPYEAPRFEDAAKMVEGASRLVVKDIAELLADSMGL